MSPLASTLTPMSRAIAEQPTEKRCRRCDEVKPITAFAKRTTTKADTLATQSYCKPCQNRVSRDSRRNRRETARRYHLKHKYNLTMEEYEEMVEQQGACCAICKRHLPLVVDHCHESKAVRGLLCDSCNVALGRFEDDVERLQAAIDYLGGQS